MDIFNTLIRADNQTTCLFILKKTGILQKWISNLSTLRHFPREC